MCWIGLLVAACSIFLWDYLITIGMEVELIWSSQWSIIKVIYIVQRYLPFIDTIWLTVHYQLGYDLSKTDCRRILSAVGYLYTFGFATSELLLALRAWAVWNHDKRLAVIMSVTYILFWFPDFGYMFLFLRSMQFGQSPFPGFVGCFVTEGSSVLALCWVVVIIWDAFILVLMAIPGIKTYRLGNNQSLLDIIYRDGLIFYIYLFIISSVQIIVIQTLPAGYIILLAACERCLHSILSSRVLLHIRAHVKAREEATHWSLSGLTALQSSKVDMCYAPGNNSFVTVLPSFQGSQV
ncbi:hypothetical protein B0H34DRAFT_269153 [Crassisporium funariophilum]|nr:hypothetical protein B0H34DRAFT_269153 [Crassisporium funariophilum]